MQELNFPACSFRFKNRENKSLIFDPVRKKFVVNTPEEWVRQHLIAFLLNRHNYPQSMIAIEKAIGSHHLNKRYDLVVFTSSGQVFMLAECKAPDIKLDQAVFDQIAQYNYALEAPYLFLTNGLVHYVAEIDFVNKRYRFLSTLPGYPNN